MSKKNKPPKTPDETIRILREQVSIMRGRLAAQRKEIARLYGALGWKLSGRMPPDEGSWAVPIAQTFPPVVDEKQ
jgi:hypothetical protein